MTAPWIVAFIVQWLVVLVLAFVCIGTLRRISAVLEQSEQRLRELPARSPYGGLLAGASIRPFTASADDGSPFTADDLVGSSTTVLFLSAGCPPCQAIARELNDAWSEATLDHEIVVVLTNPAESVELGLAGQARVVYQDDWSAWRAFEISGVPHAFVIDSAGTVLASGVPNSLRDLDELVSSTGEATPRGAAVSVSSA